MTIVTEWEIKTRMTPRSAELRLLDAAVLTWATSGQGVRNINMTNVSTALGTWRTAQTGEYARIRVPADALQTELTLKGISPGIVGGIAPSQVAPKGWRLVAYDPLVHGGSLLPVPAQTGALSATEIARINEAIKRATAAVVMARDAILEVARRQDFSPPLRIEEQAYVDFFGAYDATRLQKIVKNFRALAIAFESTPEFLDVRNRTVWSTTYGGCVRRDLVDGTGQQLALRGTVQMLFGRAFLGTGSYEKTTDDTIATLVHEFAHGVLNAVDVPDVDNSGVFQCTRASDVPTDADFGNSTDPFAHQCGTETLDRLLAQFHPAYAAVNADSYGQFTKRLLIAKRG
jgi:hypothetical protein